MGIILKFLLRNIREKKLRTILILVSITLSAALFFATMALSTTMEEMYVQRFRQYFGSAELVVHSERRSPSWALSAPPPGVMPEAAEYIAGVFQTGGEFEHAGKKVRVQFFGITLEDLARMNPIAFEQDYGIEPFVGRKLIMSRRVAERYGLKPGDSMVVTYNQKPVRFQIAGIGSATGFLTDDGSQVAFIVPRETMASLSSMRGKSTVLYAKAKTESRLEELRTSLKALYPRYMVRETVTRQQIRQWTDSMTIPFRIMLVLVVAISVFIIFTSFQVITTERLPVIGTFRSIGATRKTTDFILFAESLLYGVLGGALGCALGLGILYVMTTMTVSDQWWTAVETKLSFNALQLWLTFILATVLSFVSAVVPILRVSRIPVKDVILGLYKHTARFTKRKLVLGLVLLPVSQIVPYFMPVSLSLVVDSICLLLSIIGVTLLIPLITNFYIRIVEPLFTLLFGNIGILAVKNLRGSAGILNNIALLSIGISSLFMINTISSSAAVAVTGVYSDFTHEIQMGTWNMDRTIVQKLKTVEGVEDAYGLFVTYDTVIEGRDTRINLIHGVRTDEITSFLNVHRGNAKVDLSPLDTGKTIFITDGFAKSFNIREGDKLVLQFPKRKQEYTVAGFFTSLMWNGSYALISEKNLKADVRKVYYDQLWVKTDKDTAKTAENIRKEFGRREPWIEVVKEMEKQNVESNRQMFMILQGFSLLTLLIGTVGIVNNFIISFIERRRSFALMRSVGMSRVQNRTMIFIEAAACGFAGALIGVLSGSLMLLIIPQLLSALRLPISLIFSPSSAVLLLIGGIIITVVASLSPALRSSRLNILESLRYE